MTNKQTLKEAYKILSPYSDRHSWEFNNNLVHLNFLTSEISRDKTIFDAGCGAGILALALKMLGYNITGADKYIFKEESEFAVGDIKKLQNIWQSHGLEISSQDILIDGINKQYDVIISIATIEHQINPKNFLEQIKKITKPGGYIYLATPNVSHLLNRIRFLFGRPPLGNLRNFYQQEKNFTGHWREYTLSELKQMCVLSDLKIIAAKNVQSMRPRLSMNFRKFYVNLFRLLSYLIPGAKDTNIILVKLTKIMNLKDECPICSSVNVCLYIKKGIYPLLKCSQCGFVFIPQRCYQVKKIKSQYEQNEVSRKEYYLAAEEYDWLHFNANLKKLENYVRPGLILDVGCNIGNFMAVAKKRGWQPIGVDPNFSALSVGIKRGLIMHHNFFNKEFIATLDNQFDAINMSDVIEHSFNPLEALKLAHSVLKIGGVIIINTHNIDSYFGRRYHLKPREHMSHFNLKSISFALRQAGFEVIVCERKGRIRDVTKINKSTTKINKIENIIVKTLDILPNKLMVNKLISHILKDEIFVIAKK